MASNIDRRKLLEVLIPEGTVVTRSWLRGEAVLSDHAIDNLVKSASLILLRKGLYTRGVFYPNWQSIIYTLQQLVFLISHQRPKAELLASHRKDIREVYLTEFANMAEINIPVEELEQTRENLITIIHKSMTDDERNFLLSFKERSPKWELLGLENIEEVSKLPSVQWKLKNLSKMDHAKYQKSLSKLSEILFPSKEDKW